MPIPPSNTNNSKPFEYIHDNCIGGHNDVFKHIVLIEVVRELQKQHPNGVIVYDLHCGDGVWDLNDCATGGSIEYQKGILKLLYKCEELISKNSTNKIPLVIQNYINLLYKSTGCTCQGNLDVYPGSPVYIQNILRRTIDEHKLFDLYLTNVQWLKDQSNFTQLDVYDPKSIDKFTSIPQQRKHPIYFIDPPYDKYDDHYNQARVLATRILQMNPYATVIIYIPFICNNRYRWTYPKGIREMAKDHAKTGRYYCSMTIKLDDLQGTGMLVCNPTSTLDDILSDDVIHFLANAMNQGKDEYLVEQVMKKKKTNKS
jgi:23S rRNA A2030 N6-methylase RlmJ